MQQIHICIDAGPLTGLVFLRSARIICMLHNKIHDGLRYQKSLIATLCFSLCICAATTGATNCCAHNISLPKLLLVVIEACDAPCILVRVVITEKRPSVMKYAQDQCLACTDMIDSSDGTKDPLYTWVECSAEGNQLLSAAYLMDVLNRSDPHLTLTVVKSVDVTSVT